jgi:hypothetical protein
MISFSPKKLNCSGQNDDKNKVHSLISGLGLGVLDYVLLTSALSNEN